METQLKSKDKKAKPSETVYGHERPEQNGFQATTFRTGSPVGMHGGMDQSMPEGTFDPIPDAEHPITLPPEMMPDPQIMPDFDLRLDANFSWEMIGLGLEEPMPMQEAIDEMYDSQAFVQIHTDFVQGRKSTSKRYIPPSLCFTNTDTRRQWT